MEGSQWGGGRSESPEPKDAEGGARCSRGWGWVLWAPLGTPRRGIMELFSKSTLKAQGPCLNSPNNWPPPGLRLGFSMTGIRKVTSRFRPPPPPGLQLEGWVAWGRHLLSLGPSAGLDFEPGGSRPGGSHREEQTPVPAPCGRGVGGAVADAPQEGPWSAPCRAGPGRSPWKSRPQTAGPLGSGAA